MRGTPLNQAADAAQALTSWALGRSSGEAKSEMSSTNHLEIVSLDAEVYGERGIKNRAFDFLKALVFSIYHFNALTGQTNRSSLIEEADDIVGRKIGAGEKDSD